MSRVRYQAVALADPAEVSAISRRFVSTVARNVQMSTDTNVSATLAACCIQSALFAIIAINGLTEDEAETAAAAALQNMRDGRFFQLNTPPGEA